MSPPPPAPPPEDGPRVSISHLPVANPLFVGRDAELARLNAAWDDPATNVFSLVAFGGAGKSSLVNTWLEEMCAAGWRGAERAFGWSFYGQGTDAIGASGDSFLNAALEWFGYPGGLIRSAWEKGALLARLVRERRTLLILDGLEPLQHPPGVQAGLIKDPAVKVLVRALAVQNPGLCLITTRFAVVDVAGKAGVAALELARLSPGAGAVLLRELGAQGSEIELRRASEEFGGHALALVLLGAWLRDACDGDVRRRREMSLLEDSVDEDRIAWRVITSFAGWLPKPERQVLRLLGLFDRPAQPAELEAVRAEPAIPGLTEAIGSAHDARWRKALVRLRRARLLLESREPEALNAHPLVRAFFQEELAKQIPEAWREGNLRLYEHLRQAVVPQLPQTLEEMESLHSAVVHGCRAGRQHEALHEVFFRRILPGQELGNRISDLTALAAFFDSSWERPTSRLNPANQQDVLGAAGYNLRVQGRLVEAAQLEQARLERARIQRALTEARGANLLSELTLTLGEVRRAVALGEQGIELCDLSGDPFLGVSLRSTLANALHQSGRWEESAEVFRKAETMQAEWPASPPLRSMQGYQYCGLLLSRAEPEDGSGWAGLGVHREPRRHEAFRDVLERATQTLRSGDDWYTVFDIALDHLTLGRGHLGLALTAPGPATPGEEAEAELARSAEHLDSAVDGLREAAQESHIPRGLLARATLRRIRGDLIGAAADLNEALEIAERGSMHLHECDAHIELARLRLQQGDTEAARGHVAVARKLVDKTGYGRREREVAWQVGEKV